MSAAVEGADAGAVIRNALATVTRHTRATVAGFLSLDEEDPLPRVVHPELAQVDFSLSRQLTQRVQEEGRRVWLKAGVDDFEESESLLPFQDAVCVPLKAEGAPLGALHVYKSGRYFTEREVRFCELVAAYSAGHLARLQQCRSLQAENSRLRGQAPRSEDIIGNSPAIQELHQLIARAAPCRSTVFIHGETGSGKELVALALHRQSPRRHGPFCAVNCSAIAPTLLESELFGHEKDAFTGAHAARAGLFEQADDGTLFLDEIGDMPSDCQSKVLRALETKSYRRVGGNQEIKVDVRVLAATHKDLAALVRAGRFRQDLFFRLRVISIPVPPLRDHLEDLPTLVDHFLDKLAPECGKRKRLTRAAMQCLEEYPWPGNVRELLHVLESAVMMTDGDIVDAPNIRFFQDMPSPSSEMPQSLKLEDVEAWAICQALDRTKGNISRAAKILGISRETLAIKVKNYQIDRERWERAS
jgi:DNA-binding NtrC family response regulator